MPRPEYRPGFSPEDDNLMKNAEWSDKFFNYVPAEQSYDDRDILFESAQQFVEVNGDCPYTPESLVEDFYRRL